MAVSAPRLRQYPAAAAASRLSRANLATGLLGLLTTAFAAERLLETWSVGPRSAAHTITLLGQRISYPAANASAIVILVLALLGLAVMLSALLASARELASARRARRALAARARPRPDGTFLIDDPEVDAFCAGLWHPRVYVTSGALARLDRAALASVVLHERHHAARRDPLRLATGRVLSRALFFLPSLRRLAEREQALAELAADERAHAAGRAGLARALLVMDRSGGGVDPARVDRLLAPDASADWRFPAALFLAGAGTLALLAATAAVLARAASASVTLAPPFLSAQPCILVLAAIPASVLIALRVLWRRAGAREPDQPESAAPWAAYSSPSSSPAMRSSG